MLFLNLLEGLPLQTRVELGSSIQTLFAKTFVQKFKNAKITAISPSSSQREDVIIDFAGQPLQFEVKARLRPFSTNIVYEKTLRKDQNDPIFDAFADSFSKGKFQSFSELMNFYKQNIDPRVGFPGEKGTPSSGKIPSEFKTDDASFLEQLRVVSMQRFQEKGDNYFVIYDHSDKNFYIFHTGFGPNPLKAGSFPHFDFVKVDTYGGAYKGGMRVAFKAIVDTYQGSPFVLPSK